MKQVYFLILLFSIIQIKAFSQNNPFQKKVWDKVLNNSDVKEVKDIGETSTGYLVVLSSDNKEHSLVTILKRNGDVLKEVKFNKYKNSYLKALTITKKNEILLVGQTTAIGKGANGLNGWAVSMSINGKINWQKTFGGKKDDSFEDVVTMDDDYILMVGNTASGAGGNGNIWAVRIDSEGKEEWAVDYGRKTKEVVTSVIRVNDRYMIGGCTKLRSKENAFIFSLDNTGNDLWRIDLPEETNLLSGVCTFDEKVAFAGYQFNNNIERDLMAIKVEPADGKIIWNETYPSLFGDDYGESILQMMNGKLMLVGRSYSHKPGSSVSKIFNLVVSGDEGVTREQLSFFDRKLEHAASTIIYANNNDLLLGGMLESQPLIGRYNFNINQKPTITWNNIVDKKYKRVFQEEGTTFLNVSATIASPVLLTEEDIKFYLNGQILNNQDYYDSLKLSDPSVSTFGEEHFIYTLTNRLPVVKADSLIEMRLYNNLFNVRSEKFFFKVVRPFRLDILWIDPIEANTSKLSRTVKGNNVTVKLVVMSSEDLTKDDFHVIINGKRTAGAKYGETVMKPFMNKKKESEVVHRYNYINNIFLEKGENEIKLEVNIDGDTYHSTPLKRNYYGSDGYFGEIKVDTTFDKDLTNLHVLAIGAKHDDLKYTSKDAIDMADAFRTLEGKGLFKSVKVETLIGEKATKTNIDVALERYKTAYRTGDINRNDLFVVFISSHGFIYRDSIAGVTDWITFEKFLIQASDFDNVAREATSVAYENIIATLAAIRCKKIVLIDACFSGGVKRRNKDNGNSFFDDNASINNLIEQLSYQQPGLVTITSSTDSQPSYEDDSWKNGAFTEAILMSFEHGDINGDGIVTLSEMYSYINKTIPTIVKKTKRKFQKPTITTFNLGSLPIFEK